MADEDFEIDVEPYDGIDVHGITREVLEEMAVETQNEWIDNLQEGEGATGSHGGPYVNTGEAMNDVTYEFTGALEVRIGGDVIQLAVAEFGRQPGSPPPRGPISTWAKEKGLEPEEGDSWEDMVDAIRFAIADEGLEGFAPGTAAANKVGPTIEVELKDRIEAALERREE